MIQNFQIDQPTLGIEREYLVKGFEDEIIQDYYNYHVDTAVYFGADRFYAEMEVKSVVNFEMELAKVKHSDISKAEGCKS